MEVQEKLDELKQEKRKIKRQLQLADDIIKEDLYTAYYAVSGKEEIVADRDVEIPGMEEDMLVERTAGAVVESERNVVVMNQPANSHNDGNGQEEQINVAGKQQIDLEGTEMSRGAFRRFKDKLYDLNLEKQWYQYREEAYEKIARQWSERHKIDIVE